MYRRLEHHAGGMSPSLIHRLQVAGLRRVGLTRQKASYCHGLAERLLDGRLDLAAVAQAPDEDARKALLAVPGIGPWSADIYCLMALRRPDVWPRGDLALADAMMEIKRLPAEPSTALQESIAENWSPWRSVAARLLWHHYLTRPGRRG
jgi:DNA-3-methyladenine glycosylase II